MMDQAAERLKLDPVEFRRMNALRFPSLVMLAAAMFLVTACGLPRDSAPQAINSDDIPLALRPGQLPTPTPTAPSGIGTVADDGNASFVESTFTTAGRDSREP